jgi:hypothetical protein
MSMNFGNTAIQNTGLLAWDGTAAIAIDIRQHTKFAWTFQVIADLGVDTIFAVDAAPPSDADPCLPGTAYPVQEVLTCVAPWGTVPNAETHIVLPAGTKKGAKCSAAIPCKPDAFVKLRAVSGESADVRAVAVLSGPK